MDLIKIIGDVPNPRGVYCVFGAAEMAGIARMPTL